VTRAAVYVIGLVHVSRRETIELAQRPQPLALDAVSDIFQR